MSAHVADCVERCDRPEEAGDQRENHAKRFDLERQPDIRNDLHNVEPWSLARPDQTQQGQHVGERDNPRHQRCRLARVLIFAQEEYQARADNRQQNGKEDDHPRVAHHGITPRSVSAALIATWDVVPASIPNQKLAATSAHVGTSRLSGASWISSSSSRRSKYATSMTFQM